MLTKFACARCPRVLVGTPLKVSGPSLGATVVEQPVCTVCYAEHHNHMEQFWRGAHQPGSQGCPRCGIALTRQNSRPSNRRASDGGAESVCIICDGCHADYRKYCAAAAARS